MFLVCCRLLGIAEVFQTCILLWHWKLILVVKFWIALLQRIWTSFPETWSDVTKETQVLKNNTTNRSSTTDYLISLQMLTNAAFTSPSVIQMSIVRILKAHFVVSVWLDFPVTAIFALIRFFFNVDLVVTWEIQRFGP